MPPTRMENTIRPQWTCWESEQSNLCSKKPWTSRRGRVHGIFVCLETHVKRLIEIPVSWSHRPEYSRNWEVSVWTKNVDISRSRCASHRSRTLTTYIASGPINPSRNHNDDPPILESKGYLQQAHRIRLVHFLVVPNGMAPFRKWPVDLSVKMIHSVYSCSIANEGSSAL